MCLVSRSPVIHPGDGQFTLSLLTKVTQATVVQRVYAIGEPPADQICLFAHLRNVVVFPATGVLSHRSYCYVH